MGRLQLTSACQGLHHKGKTVRLHCSVCLHWLVCAPHRFLCRIDNSFVRTILPYFICAPAIITTLILVCRRDTYLTRMMSSQTMQAAGIISYPVYLLQTPVFLAVARTFSAERASQQYQARSIRSSLLRRSAMVFLFEAPSRSLRGFTPLESGSSQSLQRGSRKTSRPATRMGAAGHFAVIRYCRSIAEIVRIADDWLGKVQLIAGGDH